ncbi:hypothetical protein HMPREF9176_0389 [Streptococcus downei F0415]|nr:hypothetical protein HMPREF9176_0389 [Streptococcus downei F0415]
MILVSSKGPPDPWTYPFLARDKDFTAASLVCDGLNAKALNPSSQISHYVNVSNVEKVTRLGLFVPTSSFWFYKF